MKNTILISLVSCLLASACRSPSDNIMRRFKSLSDSINERNRAFEEKYNGDRYYYEEISKRKFKFPALGLKADSMHTALLHVFSFVDSLEKLLPENDSLPENRAVLAKLLLADKAEQNIDGAILNFYETSVICLVNKDEKTKIDEAMKLELSYTRKKGWTRDEFEFAPVSAAKVMLLLFRNNAKVAGSIVMKDIYEATKTK